MGLKVKLLNPFFIPKNRPSGTHLVHLAVHAFVKIESYSGDIHVCLANAGNKKAEIIEFEVQKHA